MFYCPLLLHVTPDRTCLGMPGDLRVNQGDNFFSVIKEKCWWGLLNMSKYCLPLSHTLKVTPKGRFHTAFLISEQLFYNTVTGGPRTSLSGGHTAQLQQNWAESTRIWVPRAVPQVLSHSGMCKQGFSSGASLKGKI